MFLTELFAVLRWWTVLFFLGMAATPLAFVLFQKLADRGYAFVKMVGLLMVSYLFWILGSLGFLTNDLGSILLCFGLLIALSLWLYWHHQKRNMDEPTLWDWLWQNRLQVLLSELVFLSLFLIWVWVRAQNPAITATEKPMEFAFLNAVGRSPGFPPLDPWLSGFGISYYYFGYVMTSVISRLANVSEQIAFNLGIAWLVAGTATGAFGLVYNLLAIQKIRKSARILGLIAAIAIPLAGNLVIGLEMANARGIGSASFWQWLDVRDLKEPAQANETPRYQTASWWWWRSSRPIHEYHLSGLPEDGLEPIAEFPAFSFVLGDMHPHVLALPFALLTLALALAWWLPNRGTANDPPLLGQVWDEVAWKDRLRMLRQEVGLPLWLFSALVLGGLAFLNTWDLLIYLFVIAGAFLLARWRENGWHTRIISQTLTVVLLLLAPIVLLYLPFFIGFRSQAGFPYLLPMLMQPTRFVHFLFIFGMSLWPIVVLLIALVVRQGFHHWEKGLAVAGLLIMTLFLLTVLFGLILAISPEGAGRVITLANELGIFLNPRPEQALPIGWAFSAVLAILPKFLSGRATYPVMTLFLASMAGMVVMIWLERFQIEKPRVDRNRFETLPFALLLILTATLLTLGPEFVYLRDNFGVRLNTIFKFYYQAWLMFSVSALFAIGYFWQSWQSSSRIAPIIATTGYAFTFLIALLFPVFAVNSRALEYRGPVTAETRQPATIDGLAHVKRHNSDEYEAILWLRENIDGAPVVLEAVGGQYSQYGRVAASTGLPTLLGWAGHQYQWRGDTPEPAIREPVVNQIYSQPDLLAVADLLNQYGVEYIYVGNLEQQLYGQSGLGKFAENLDIAFSNGTVTIYRWQPQ